MRQRLEGDGTEIAWTVFRARLLEKYFPGNVCSKKDIEFLALKQGSLTIVEYATMFEELVKFFLHYNVASVEGSKCIKFESGLRPQIKQSIKYQEIHQFDVLVNRCQIYDEDCKARYAHYKSLSDKKVKEEFRGKLYVNPADKGKQKATVEKKLSGGEASASVQCYRCGVIGHRAKIVPMLWT